jgi:hypothetical protein
MVAERTIINRVELCNNNLSTSTTVNMMGFNKVGRINSGDALPTGAAVFCKDITINGVSSASLC